jgi:hypothetical protein
MINAAGWMKLTSKPTKQVLFITYYWPPAGGSGVQRPVKFVKYLREFGWEPIVFTVANGEYPEKDSSLQDDIPEDVQVIKASTLEPYSLFRKITGNKHRVDANLFHSKKRKGIVSKLLFWVRSNLFIPDARVLWILPSIIKLYPFLRRNKVDAIISTGPPHTVHIIAKRLSKLFGIPWLADFRDPWTKIDYFEKLDLSPLARKIHQRLEHRVLTTADCVVTVSPFLAGELEKLSSRKVHVLTNGFDEDNFPKMPSMLDRKFTIVHMGMLGEARNHAIFWQALDELVQENEDFRKALEVRFYGKVDASVSRDITPALGGKIFIEQYVEHSEVPGILRRAHLLYLPIHDCAIDVGFLPGKLFEYLAARRPILSIGPTAGDTANLIQSLNVGITIDYAEKTQLKNYLKGRFHAYQVKEPFAATSDLDQFKRRTLTLRLSDLLNTLRHS